jgi:hypothetical protein
MTEPADKTIDRLGDPIPDHLFKSDFEPYPEPESHIVYRGVPRCPWDGSAMPYTVFNAQRSIWSGPEPGYLFECEICGWEDEIS